MKQLKFMIAATAAIGLAGVAQAVFPSTTEQDADSNTGFEEFEADTAATTGTDDYFRYTGNNSEDNESKIIAGAATLADGVEKSGRAKGTKFNANANVLQVNTGTDPLLRTINIAEEGKDLAPVTVPDTGIYIDTLVQFTVTPAGDTVTPTADDKLMIYLQEVAPVMEGETVITAGATNLMVKCCEYTEGRTVPPPALPASWTTNDYVAVLAPESGVASTSVKAGEWYRLTVLAKKVGTATVFEININGVPLNPTLDGVNKLALTSYSADTKYFPSLKPDDTTLKAVGFAGEGKVDDIVFSTTQEAIVDAIDFTFVLGEGVTSVSWTVGGNTYTATATTAVTSKVSKTDEVEITDVDYADWYVASGTYVKGWEGTGITANLTVAATKVGSSESPVDDFVEDATSAEAAAAALGVENTAFTSAGAAPADDAKAVLTKGLNWAKKLGEAPSYLNGIDFADPTDVKAKAYLLNCDPEDVDTIDDQFKFEAFSFEIVDGTPVVDIDGVATSWKVGENAAVPFNGTPVIKGAATPNGTYGDINANSKFFKAFLVK